MAVFQCDGLGANAGSTRPQTSAGISDDKPELAEDIRRIVSRVVRRGRATSPLARQILSVAAHVRNQRRGSIRWDDEEMVTQVTQRICGFVEDVSQPNALTERWLRDTVGSSPRIESLAS